MVRARHEGSRFDSDVFLADQGLLPVQVARSATSSPHASSPSSRCPRRRATPSSACVASSATRRSTSTRWSSGSSPGLSRDGQPIYLDLCVPRRPPRRARRTSPASPASRRRRPMRASFSTRCSTPACSAPRRPTRRRSIFNVKGEDLLFLDRANAGLDAQERVTLRATRAPGRTVRVGRHLGPGPARGRRPDARYRQPAARRHAPTSGPSATSSATGSCASCSPRTATSAARSPIW